MLGETVCMLVLFSYFLCVTVAYADLMHGPEEEEGDAAAADEPEDDKKSEKSKKSEEKKEEEGEGDKAGDAEGGAE